MNFSDLSKEMQDIILESQGKSSDFRTEYNRLHECCPNCGSIPHMSTLMGFPMYDDNLEAYKDLNDCTCVNCGDKHTTHERVPKK